VVGLFLAPTPPSPAYHRFADRRSFLGIPNFGDVTSTGVCAARLAELISS
jgi:hypothetical protein